MGEPEIWRRVLGYYTESKPEREPGKQIQHYAVLMDCNHELPVEHGQAPARMRCPDCEAGKPANV